MKHISFLCRIVSTLILVFGLTISLFSFFGNRLRTHYLAVASLQSNNVASLVCLNSVSDLINNKYSLVDFLYEDNNTFDNSGLNNFMKDSVNVIYQEIRKVERGESQYFTSPYGNGIIYEIPFNLFSDNVLLSAFGAKIPVKFTLIGDVKGKIVSKVEEFGINNALINLNMLVSFASRIIVPLTSEIVNTEIEIPIYTKIYNGKIPQVLFPMISSVGEVYSEEVAI